MFHKQTDTLAFETTISQVILENLQALNVLPQTLITGIAPG